MVEQTTPFVRGRGFRLCALNRAVKDEGPVNVLRRKRTNCDRVYVRRIVNRLFFFCLIYRAALRW